MLFALQSLDSQYDIAWTNFVLNFAQMLILSPAFLELSYIYNVTDSGYFIFCMYFSTGTETSPEQLCLNTKSSKDGGVTPANNYV